MKSLVASAVFLFSFISCTQEKPDSTAPADYKETYNDLVQNKKDSVNTKDSLAVHPPAGVDSTAGEK